MSNNYQDDLKGYIRRNLKKGYTKESLRQALLRQGNSKYEVEKALKSVDKELAQQAPELKTKPVIKYEVIEPKNFSFKYKESLFQKLSRFLGF